MPTPEELARINIDKQLTTCGWTIQDMAELNRYASLGVAVREFPLETGEADYLLFVDGKAVGVIEAKPEGTTLSGVAEQAGNYVAGLPANIPHVTLPLPFQYESTGIETYFRDNRDPAPRSRRVFAFHRPEQLNDWLTDGRGDPSESTVTNDSDSSNSNQDDGLGLAGRPYVTLRGRLQNLPPLNEGKMWSAQIEAVTNLEASLGQDKPRALIQMATGSGKTFTAINAIYRLIKFGKAKRVLFLVDRANLAKQALKEFQAFETPDDGRKFTELYNVTRLESNAIDPVNKVVITTIQRLYSILSGEVDFDSQNEEGSLFEVGSALDKQPPKEVKYNARIPIEFFDVIITDECHRSIYNLWHGALEYFDAHLIGLTATPSKQTLGFFNQNLVMEYSRTRAVADGVNVDGEVYRIRTKIGDAGNTVEAGEWVGLDIDTKGEIYEGLLEKNAQDTKSGAGQYFTPRPLIQAMVEIMRPQLGQIICDPTGGFLLAAHDYINKKFAPLDKGQLDHLNKKALNGWEIVDNTARLCVMNLYLHGIGMNGGSSPIHVDDSLAADPGSRFDMILTNPPFGKKSSVTFVTEEGEVKRESSTIVRDDFWASTSNKLLNFVQHVKTLLEINGKAAVVVPDNVLFEGGAGETVRRKLLHECDVHTLLRLPTGLFYAQGVKANVLFFDRKPPSETP